MSSNVRREGLPVPVNRGLLLASAKKRRDLIRSERQRLAILRDHIKVCTALYAHSMLISFRPFCLYVL